MPYTLIENCLSNLCSDAAVLGRGSVVLKVDFPTHILLKIMFVCKDGLEASCVNSYKSIRDIIASLVECKYKTREIIAILVRKTLATEDQAVRVQVVPIVPGRVAKLSLRKEAPRMQSERGFGSEGHYGEPCLAAFCPHDPNLNFAGHAYL